MSKLRPVLVVASRLIALSAIACGSQQPQTSAPPHTAAPAIAQPAPRDAAAIVEATPQACWIEPERPVFRDNKFGTPKRRDQPTNEGWEVHEKQPLTCQVADSNIVQAMDTIMKLPAAKSAPVARWDRKTKPAYFDLVAKRFNLNAMEQRKLYADGFVVPARFAQPSYGWAYHEIYQSQLPVFVTVDSVMNAVYAAHDGLVSKLERRELEPLVKSMLATLHCKLPVLAGRYPEQVAKDLDLYLVVARRLLGDSVASALGDASVEQHAARLVADATAAGPMKVESLFGRDRVIDWSQYQPRGHYSKDGLETYFRAVMWLSRIELNIVSRSSRSSQPGQVPNPQETPHETVVALALADLVEASGQSDNLARFEQVFGFLAGAREDIPLPELLRLARSAGLNNLEQGDAAALVRGAVGNSYQRQARIHYMPEGSTTLPAIASFLGPRILADTIAMRPLAHSVGPSPEGGVPNRHRIRAADVAYVLGHDRAKQHLAGELAAFPTLGTRLDEARQKLAAAPRGDDLYTAWLDSIRAIAVMPHGALPTFMRADAYKDLKINSAVAAFAQIRHNHVLIAGQAYGEGGCRIPDGFVEPAPDVYDALVKYGELGAKIMIALDGRADAEREYFLRLAKVSKVLARISRMELANQPLPPTARGFLGMVSEMLPYGSDGRPTYTGWYFDLFHDRTDAIAQADLIADFFTSMAGVSYAGVQPPTLGIFVVDTGGGPRTFVGPVARAYEYQGPQSPRLDDKAARKLDDKSRVAPWSASYSLASPPEPTFVATFESEWGETFITTKVVVEAPRALGTLAIELRDHHRTLIAKVTKRVGAGKTVFEFPKRRNDDEHASAVDFIVFTAGAFFGERELSCMDGCAPMAFGALRAKYEYADEYDSEAEDE